MLSTGAAREVLKSRDSALYRVIDAKEARNRAIKDLEQVHMYHARTETYTLSLVRTYYFKGTRNGYMLESCAYVVARETDP